MKKIPLDTPSIMFTALTTESWGRTFGFSARLKNGDIDPSIMVEACKNIAPDYPICFTNLRNGMFWNYQVPSGTEPNIYEKDRTSIKPIGFRNDGKPDFRLTYSGNKIAFEAAHCLGDGKGLLRFFESIIIEYSRLKSGDTSPCKTGAASGDRLENAFETYYDKRGEHKKKKTERAYHFPEESVPGYLEMTFVKMGVDEIKTAAHRENMTVTEYLTAVFILGAIRAEKKPIEMPVSVFIPVDLRRFFPTNTGRNFVLQTLVGFNSEGRRNLTLSEVCAATKGLLRQQLNKREMAMRINDFGHLIHNPVIQLVPNAIKKPVLRFGQKVSHNTATTIFTNLGNTKVPEEIEDIIYDLRFMNGDTSAYGLVSTVSCVSASGELTLCWSQTADKSDWINECISILNDDGVKAYITH